MTVQIKLCDYRELDDPVLLHAYRELLSDDECARLDTFRNDDAALAFVVGRALLRCSLATRLGCTPSAIALAIDDWGRPRLADRDVDFNLSHGHGLLALAISDDGEVGVDIEYSGRSAEVLRLARRYFRESEVEILSALDEHSRREHFFRLWTLKEAYVKAVGRGIANTLNTVGFDVDDNGVIGASVLDGRRPAGLHCWLYQAQPRYPLAVVSLAEHEPAAVDPQLSWVVPLREERPAQTPLIAKSV